MSKALKNILFLHIILVLSLLTISQSFHFLPFFKMELKETLENSTLFFTLFFLPLSFLISMFGVANESK